MKMSSTIPGVRLARATMAAAIALASVGAAPASAADPTLAGAATIGTVGGAAGWAGLWRTDNAGNVWNGYTIITGSNNNTYINTPSANGNIFFRGANSGPLSDPEGWTSRAWLDRLSTLHLQSIEAGQYINAGGTITAAGISALVPASGSASGQQWTPLYAQNLWKGTETDGNTYAMRAYGVRNGIRTDAGDNNALEAYSTSGTGVYAQTLNGNRYAGVFRGTSSGLYGQGAVYGVYSDGPLYVNSSDTSKASGSDHFAITSDRRVKKDIEDYAGGLAELEKVRPVRFKYNGLAGTETSNKEYVGVIAQEVEEIAPYMVSSTHRKLRDTDDDAAAVKQLDSSAFTYMLINAVKELAAQNRKLAARVAEQDEAITKILASAPAVQLAQDRSAAVKTCP